MPGTTQGAVVTGQLRVRGSNEGLAEQESPCLSRPSWLNNGSLKEDYRDSFLDSY